MSASQLNDNLRKESREFQRDKDQRAKWHYGKTPKCGRGCLGACMNDCLEDGAALRPVGKPGYNAYYKRQRQRESQRGATQVSKAIRNDIYDGMDVADIPDTSSDEDVHDASAAPLPTEAEFMYDSRHGPLTGQTILSAALSKAVQRFENTETEKLVTREYDVIDQLKEGYTADDDEDYEIIEHAHLK